MCKATTIINVHNLLHVPSQRRALSQAGLSGNPSQWKGHGNGSTTKLGARLGCKLPLLLPVLQAPYEPRVRLDAGALALDEVESMVVAHLVRVDEVCDHDRRRA